MGKRKEKKIKKEKEIETRVADCVSDTDLCVAWHQSDSPNQTLKLI